MNITNKDKQDMLNASKLYDDAMCGAEKGRDFAVLPMGLFLGSNKEMILDIYKAYKANGRLVYFKNYEGLWILDQKGDITLSF